MHLHVDLVSVWVEIKHDRLLREPVLTVNLRSDLVEILVNRLLKVERRGLDSVDVSLDLGESDHSFLDLPVRPN